MNDFTDFDLHCMQRALELASMAQQKNEVPIGAVIASKQQIILGEGFNQPISSNDPTAHAEIIAMRQAAQKLNNYRLIDTTMYVTLEPCPMCAGAMLQARIKRLVFGATDARAGAIGGAMDLFGSAAWNHAVHCTHGLLAQECGSILQGFFQSRR